jgi:GNAT superfamily N-acetyltransferase
VGRLNTEFVGSGHRPSDPGWGDLRHLPLHEPDRHNRGVTTTFASTTTIRPIEPDDRAALSRFYEGLSPDSLNRRFHGACRGIADTAACLFCGPDHEHREGIVAVQPSDDGSEPRIVGHLCLEPSGSGELEMAVAVADDVQHQGLGRALLAAAIVWAQGHKIGRLRASMRCSNGAIISLVRGTGYPVTWTTSRGGGLEAIIEVGSAVHTAA